MVVEEQERCENWGSESEQIFGDAAAWSSGERLKATNSKLLLVAY